MLGVRNYSRDYIDRSRAKVESDLRAYRELMVTGTNQTETGGAPSDSARSDFETTFFNNMVLLLEYLFVHRLRTVEGKDGNPLNEVRVICDALLLNQGKLGVDKTIKWTPAKTVLGYQVGDEIRLDEADFQLLSSKFFAEIEAKFQ